MRLLITFFVIASAATSALAQEVRGTFSTILAGRQDPRRGDVVSVIPLYELVSMEVGALALPFAEQSRLVLQGWGRYQVGEDEQRDSTADVNLLYLEAQGGPLTLRLGRQHVVPGVSRMALVDGIEAKLQLGYGLSAMQNEGAWPRGKPGGQTQNQERNG